jgi:Fe-S-cluster-containing dehydrogenase component
MSRYGMIIDINKCNGCYNCFLACKDEYTENDYMPYSVGISNEARSFMKVTEKEMGKCPKIKVDYVAQPCFQCANATCVKMATEGEVYRRADGIIIIDPVKAKGKREIVNSCPHRVIQWNEKQGVAQKCTFCIHLLEKGAKEPRCVEACPSGALIFGDLDNPNSEIAKNLKSAPTQELNASYNLKPSVVYRNLPGRLVAGEVIFSDKQEVGAKGVKVTLKGDKIEKTTETDFFGDFEFKSLPADKPFTITIEAKGYKSQTINIKTDKDINLSEIFVSKA